MTIIYSAIMSIYMIRPNEPSLHDFYIGSCEDFITRMAKHKYNCNNENSRHYNVKVYQHMRANGGWDAWKMIKIASVWKKATKPLFQIEQDYIDTYKPSLNCKRAYQTKEQLKEQKKENDREYREKNRDILREKAREKFTCECGTTLRKSDKARHNRSIKHQNYIQSLSSSSSSSLS